VTACDRIEDLSYLRTIMRHEAMSTSGLMHPKGSIEDTDLSKIGSILFTIDLKCYLTKRSSHDSDLTHRNFESLIKLALESLSIDASDLAVVPIVISKDHHITSRYGSLFGYGAFCAQFLEPYSLREYIEQVREGDPVKKFTQHIQYDLSVNVAHLPAHLIAFFLLYLNREAHGVSYVDLLDYSKWMMKNSLEFNLQFAFTGKLQDIVKSAVLILEKYIHIDQRTETYYPIDLEALADYADTMIPNLVCYGIIARSILNVHNADPKNDFRLFFDPGDDYKVMKDDVIELSVDLAENLDKIIVFRRPCISLSTLVLDTFTKMETFGHYFKTLEPKVRRNTGKHWAGDCDSDEEYYWSRKDDPAFKSWILLTRRPYRLDRLNLFMNAIDKYISTDDGSTADFV